MKRHFVPVVVAAALLVPAAAVSGSTSPIPSTVTASEPTGARPSAKEKKYERKIRVHTNKARKNHDRKRLHRRKCVDRFANRWARKMARRQELAHQSLRPILRKCDLSRVGENIAMGYHSGRQVVRAWMHSPGHRRNILNRRYRQLGVGVSRDENGVAWTSQVFGRG